MFVFMTIFGSRFKIKANISYVIKIDVLFKNYYFGMQNLRVIPDPQKYKFVNRGKITHS